MEIVYKKRILDKIKDSLYNVYKQQGEVGLDNIDYIRVTQQERDEIGVEGGFAKVGEIAKCFLLSQGYNWAACVVKIKVAE